MRNATDVAELKKLPVLISCQGGDYTNEIYPKLRREGWKGYWIDAASALRMNADAVIILDPVNMPVIESALGRGVKDYIGGNCTVSLMLMATAGLFERDEIEWLTSMTYQAASGGARRRCASWWTQMAAIGESAKRLLGDPASAILDIDRSVSGSMRSASLPKESIGASARGEPAALDRQGPRQRPEPRGMEGPGREATRFSGARATAAPPSRWTAFACAWDRCAATARRSPSSCAERAARRGRGHARGGQRMGEGGTQPEGSKVSPS